MDALLYCFFNYMCFKFQMFLLVDKDKNGFISFREFVDMLIIFAKGKRCYLLKICPSILSPKWLVRIYLLSGPDIKTSTDNHVTEKIIQKGQSLKFSVIMADHLMTSGDPTNSIFLIPNTQFNSNNIPNTIKRMVKCMSRSNICLMFYKLWIINAGVSSRWQSGTGVWSMPVLYIMIILVASTKQISFIQMCGRNRTFLEFSLTETAGLPFQARRWGSKGQTVCCPVE